MRDVNQIGKQHHPIRQMYIRNTSAVTPLSNYNQRMKQYQTNVSQFEVQA